MLIRYLSLLLCVIVHGVHSANNNDLTFREKAERYMKLNKECKRIEAWEYDYSQFIDVRQIENSRLDGYIIKLTTYVLGTKDVHILLSSTDAPDLINDEVYEFVIGAWGNTRTAIRKKTQNYPDLNNEETRDILLPEVPLKVVITITNNGGITLQLEHPFKAIEMHAVDKSPIAVNFVSFATSDNAMVEYFYNCPAVDKQLASIKTKELTAKCKYVVTVENTYNTFHRISDFNALQPDGLMRFPLIIRGDSDAHILFATKKYFEWDIAYEIVIGASGNRRAYIRTSNDDIKLAETVYNNILPMDIPLITIFEISKAGYIRIFAKESFNAKFKLLMVGQLRTAIPVNFISFHASESSQNEYYYACPYNVRRNDLYVAGDASASLAGSIEDNTYDRISYAKAQVYAECNSVHAVDGNQNKFTAIDDIRDGRPDGYLARIPIFVEGNQDAKILLSTSNRPNFATDKLYQIVIGGWSDSRSVIRTRNSNTEQDVIASVLESDILAEGRLVKLIIEISIAGEIKVFIQQNPSEPARALIVAFDPHPIPIRYIAFTTIGNSTNEFYYECNL